MTTPPPQTLSPHLPLHWDGGRLDYLAPLVEDFYDECHADLERVLEMTDWTALEPLVEGDPPEPWGFDPGSRAGAGPRLEARSGAVLRVSASGVVLDDHPDTWLNTSRYGPPVDLRPVHTGDVAVAQVELGRDGRCYLASIRVLPLDEPHAPSQPAEAEHGGTP